MIQPSALAKWLARTLAAFFLPFSCKIVHLHRTVSGLQCLMNSQVSAGNAKAEVSRFVSKIASSSDCEKQTWGCLIDSCLSSHLEGSGDPRKDPASPLGSQCIMQNAHLTISRLQRPKLNSWDNRQHIWLSLHTPDKISHYIKWSFVGFNKQRGTDSARIPQTFNLV